MTSAISDSGAAKVVKLSVSHSDFTAGAANETINIWTIPARAQITGVVCVVTETPDDSDGDLSAWSLMFGESTTPDTDAFLTTHDYIADAPGTIYSTKGAALTLAQGFVSASATSNLTCRAVIVGTVLNDTDINAGAWDVYVTYVQH